jgi:hypothetical protein
MQMMTATLQQVLDNGNPRAGSLIARLNQVLDTPDVQVQEPLVVVKKRGRLAGFKNKTSIVATLLWPSVGVKPNTWKKSEELESSATPKCSELYSKAQNTSH